MSIAFLTIYIMFWTLGICASYAFVMDITKKAAQLLLLRRLSLAALLSYGVSWFFGVLYYIHPDTMARFVNAIPPSSNTWLYLIFVQSRECVFASFSVVSVFAAWLAFKIHFTNDETELMEKKNDIMVLSMAITVLGIFAILLAIMIA